MAHCINSLKAEENTENFTYTYTSSEYHYTLYYYDLSGNLAMTVPPKGVDILDGTETTAVATARTTTGPGDDVAPHHTLKTQYHYNSLNQLVFQETPDAGTSKFWYDHLGRLVLSQNAKQNKNYTAGGTTYEKYSFTKFDELGRITQVGEIWCLPNIENETTFQADINESDFPDDLDAFRYSVTETFYNTAYTFGTSPFGAAGQENLRNRISYVSIEETYDNNPTTFDHATHYCYDIHGNVKTLVQDNSTLSALNNQYKLTKYDYDLISGNVNYVYYQPGKVDMFTHKYLYDDINRLIQVETSRDARIWERDARYAYYRHGPLARQEIGDLMVQGVDYAYTIQGWLKGVNSGALNTGKDMGNDGKPKTAALNTNQRIASDAYGYILEYFNGDYSQIDPSAGSFIPDQGVTVGGTFAYYDFYDHDNSPNLYNGNIRAMTTALMKTDRTKVEVLGKTYQYDQLNRLVNSYSFVKSGMHVNGASFSWVGVTEDANNRWGTSYVYDGMGNILSMNRSGNTGTGAIGGARQFDMDKMTYNYYTNSTSSKEGSNQLARVADAIGDGAYSTIDIDNQTSSTNYEYDEIGNLIKDVKEGINSIIWNVYGKIKSIDKSAGPDLEFAYDATGQRIMKKVTPASGPTLYTYYIRDAQGNVMATYDRTQTGGTNSITLAEQHIYGSSRLGLVSTSKNVGVGVGDPTFGPKYSRYLGEKRYELVNHLGNVLEVITDRRFQIQETATGFTHTVKYYEPDVVSMQDYDPFGMLLVGRNWEGGSGYRYGFNNKENDDEIAGSNNALDFGARVYDARLGIWMSIDPLTAKFPSWSPYSFAMVSPIANVDIEGNENVIYLVLLPSSSPSLSTSDVTNIINLANSNFQALGVKTRVVLSTEFCGSDVSAFDPNKIDVTDGIVVLGNAKEVIKFIDSYGPNSMKWDDFGAPEDASNPETSENKGVGGGGKWIAIDASDIPVIAKDIHTESSLEDKKAQFGALLINHGAGHLAGMNHTGSMKIDDQVTIPTDEGFTFSFIMQDGNGLLSDINNPNVGYTSLTSDSPDDQVKMYYYTDSSGKEESKKVINISRNSDYDSYNKARFSDEESKVNYKK